MPNQPGALKPACDPPAAAPRQALSSGKLFLPAFLLHLQVWKSNTCHHFPSASILYDGLLTAVSRSSPASTLLVLGAGSSLVGGLFCTSLGSRWQPWPPVALCPVVTSHPSPVPASCGWVRITPCKGWNSSLLCLRVELGGGVRGTICWPPQSAPCPVETSLAAAPRLLQGC